MLMRLMSKGEYLIIPKGMKFTGSGKLGLKHNPVIDNTEGLKWLQLSIVHPLNLRGNCTPDQILVCFVLYLKIINTFFKYKLCIL